VPELGGEDAAAAYTAKALEALRRAWCLEESLRCYSDYDPALWVRPPSISLPARARSDSGESTAHRNRGSLSLLSSV